jgi:hypothetical protein
MSKSLSPQRERPVGSVPNCPSCRLPMRLALKVRADDGLEEYMYECSICGTTESQEPKRN